MSSAPDSAISTPRPELSITGVDWQHFAAAPTLVFTCNMTESSGREIYTVALSCQINIDPARRRYESDTRASLVELFGEPQRWGATTRSFMWTRSDVLVPSFRGATSFTIPLACTYDMELAAAKYFYSLPDGEVPLTFHLSGSIMFKGDEAELRITQVPWDIDTKFLLPVGIWRSMMQHHYPNGTWLRVGQETLDRLARVKVEEGLYSYEAVLDELLDSRPAPEEGATG
jgi:hypothetical protein